MPAAKPKAEPPVKPSIDVPPGHVLLAAPADVTGCAIGGASYAVEQGYVVVQASLADALYALGFTPCEQPASDP